MRGSIQTPRLCVDMLTSLHDMKQLTNPSVCTQMNIGNYQISISMDASHGDGDLFRTDIRVFDMIDGDNTMNADVTGNVSKVLNLPTIINSPQELFKVMDLLINHADEFRSGNLKLLSVEDITGHKEGCKILQPTEVLNVEMNGKNTDVAVINNCTCLHDIL